MRGDLAVEYRPIRLPFRVTDAASDTFTLRLTTVMLMAETEQIR